MRDDGGAWRRGAGDAEDGEDSFGSIIEGRQPVAEALRAGRPIDKLYVVRGARSAGLARVVSEARESGAVVQETDIRKLDSMSRTRAHQGVIAVAAAVRYAELSDILEIAAASGRAPLVVVCDGISDPHNLGAIIRTADAAGAHGVVISKRRSAPVTATAVKASSGAASHVAVARVTNLTASLGELKKSGLWVFAASPDGDTPLWDAELARPAAIVIGAEGGGISRLVGESCDYAVKIPMFGKLQSLNASVSAAVMLYEAVRQRNRA
ncbi:MAG: 23S rRNA (guanosine(2251)-2'-O)-methyltransferase RlmB [Oscillospiraceae bacterium]|jgi:23S rRNA (guanosine2251-2'-O)-methyltransferase|nr:23S rRNA (guanosine(2251)-2'-O)-methyltransferase RlmB [Oscillospiraceae bacterium]